MMFSAIFSKVIGPVFSAISFIPAKITTALGFKFTTSGMNLINICGVVCPPIPRFINGLFIKKSLSKLDHPSVIEFPMKTTRFGSFIFLSSELLCSYFFR